MNAVSCLIFGIVFVIWPYSVAVFLAEENVAPIEVVVVLGIVLILNGLHLIWAARQRQPGKQLALYFSIGDFAWVIGSLALMTTGYWVSTSHGLLAAGAVTLVVGALGTMQLLQSRKLTYT